jgi:hypothetical protein
MAAGLVNIDQDSELVRGVSSGQRRALAEGTICHCLFRLELAQAHQGSETTVWQVLQNSSVFEVRQAYAARLYRT